MKIKTITAQDLKGRSFVHELKDINVLRGDNWSGKTSVLAAIRLGLIGYEPKLGKRATDTFKLATGDVMQVKLDFGQVKLSRRWTMKKGSVKTEMDVPEGWVVPSLLLDISDWFALTAQGRRDHVLGLLDFKSSGFSDEQLITAIKSLSVEPRYKEHDDEINDLCEEREFWMGDRDANKVSMADWLALEIVRLKEKVTERLKVADQQDALIQTIMQERAANPQGIPKDQMETLQQLDDQRAELNKRLGQLVANAKTKATIESAKAELAKFPADLDTRRALLQRRYEDNTNALKVLKVQMGDGSNRMRCERLEARLSAVNDSVAQLAEQRKQLVKKLKVDLELDCCPTCKSKNSAAGLKLLIREAHDKAIADIATKNMQLLKQAVELEEQIAPLKAAQDAEENAVSNHAKLASVMDEQKAELNSIAIQLQRRDIWQKQVKQYEEAAGVQLDDNETALNSELEAVNSLIGQAHSKQKLRLLLTERQAQEAQALTVRDEQRRKVEIDSKCLALLVRVQSEIIVKAFDPLLLAIRKFTDGLLSFELSHREGDLGYVGPRGQWVSHLTFSGAEQAITYAGLGVALASQSRVKLVMLDELLVSRGNKLMMAEKMKSLIDQGVIDQFVICDTESAGWPGYTNMIEL